MLAVLFQSGGTVGAVSSSCTLLLFAMGLITFTVGFVLYWCLLCVYSARG